MKSSRRGFLKFMGLVAIATQIPIDLTIRAKQKIKKYLTFNEMLKEHYSMELVQKELLRQNYLFAKIKVYDNFPSAPIVIPFSLRDKK